MRKEGKKVYSDKEYRQRKKTNWWKPFKKQLADLKKKRDKLLGTNSKRRAKNWVFVINNPIEHIEKNLVNNKEG